MEIIIAGAGKVGRAIAQELSAEGHDLTLIDQKSEVLEGALESYDVFTVQGNCAGARVLDAANVRQAEVFIAATSSDEINLLSCLTARVMNPSVHTIARICQPEYAAKDYDTRKLFGLELMINPDAQAAAEIARQLKYPGFLKRETFAKARVEIVELRLTRGSRLINVKLADLNKVVRCRVLIAAVLRDDRCIMPDGNFVLNEDDRIFVTGDAEELHVLLREIGIITSPIKHVLIAGGSRIAYYLTKELEKVDISAAILEIDDSRCKTLAELLPKAVIINGDASKLSVLESEEIESYDGFVACTGIDELNILASLYADSVKVLQVVTKLSRGENIRLLNTLPIGAIVCPKDLCTMHIVRYVRALKNQKGAAITIHKIAGGHCEAIEFRADEMTRHLGEKLADIRTKKDVLIVSINHRNTVEIPSGESTFTAGDTIVVVTSADNIISTLNDIFED